ncbi:MAG: YebC/PmpR family DNA-binding transcriptional regulator [Bacteroidales bacterium]|nr:YebC/PmpR family DNA-binding transcriptional regulator [Bacteroidales bacterium]MBN2762735.1 YebC/PmpR family DNA-binding transcriptional regulator [Bacteroidales bacterium]
MSGHSKWSTIKRKKGALDAKRGKIFSRIVKEIQMAVKEGGPNPDGNPRLRLAIQNAKGANMPKDNVERAINKASNEAANLQEVTYEGYAPGGIAIFIECLTDNTQRTVSNIRAIYNKRGGSLGTNGSLSFIFQRKGVFTVLKNDLDTETFELEIIDAGVEDIELNDDVFTITTAIEDFGKIHKKLEEMNVQLENAELQRIAIETKSLDLESARKVLRMIEEFEEIDDVQSVYHNLEISDELEAALEAE